jgi:tetratricopeptide (TPR) repeat protein
VRRTSGHPKFRSRLLVGLLLWSPAAVGAQSSGFDASLESIDRSTQMVEARLTRLEREYGHRRGLIGAEEAESRYEDAVFAYLVEDFERAATIFFTLVEAEALVRVGLAQDAEWYLGECLFEEGNYVTAVEAYQRIVDGGREHPFFSDAVRRQLEAFGRLKDTAQFYEVYNRYIVTAIVPTTSAVRYSIAKSFYHQGDAARAKGLFAEIPTSSRHYTRARYLLGAILVEEGQLEAAVIQFDKVHTYMPPAEAENYHGYGGIKEFARMRAMETEVAELSRLALGRLNYELGKFDVAQRYYQDIRRESEHFTDQLYELVWTYVKQDKWLEAINQIEIFLLAYPEHHYAFQLRLLLGHLFMRRNSYERALATYEDVVETYRPIRERLQRIGSTEEEPAVFFAAMVTSKEFEEVDPNLPPFAVDLLVEQDQVGRAVDTTRELGRQETDLDYSQDLVDLVGPALQTGTKGIGTFRQGRNAIAAIRNDGLGLRGDITEYEIDWLEANADDGQAAEIVPLRQRWAVLVGRSDQVRDLETHASERYEVHDTQVREVQSTAFRAQQIALDQVAQVTAMRRRLRENPSGLSDAELREVGETLAQLDRSLKGDAADLDRLQGDTVRRRVMGTVPFEVAVDTGAQRGHIGDDFAALHGDLVAYRPRVSGAGAAHREVDSLWVRANDVDSRATRTLDKLEAAESRELDTMRRRLAVEVEKLTRLTAELQSATRNMGLLGVAITQAGISDVGHRFEETVMGADRGIVDVYWVRKAGVTEEIDRLNEERGFRETELDARFKQIRSRLEDRPVEPQQ